MDPHTESSTEIAERVERPCGTAPQPHFNLIAQDATADLVVDFWILVQLRVQFRMQAGETITEALREVRTTFGLHAYTPELLDGSKLQGAALIARAMEQFPTRRLAD